MKKSYLYTSAIVATLAVLFMLLISGGCAVVLQKNINELKNNLPSQQTTSLANPASQNCINLGGQLEIRNNKIGQYGVCLFDDNRQCEEWALLRGWCPLGGLKVTGYENEAQVYCAITGGQVEGVGTATQMCKRVDGTYCNAQANFDGDCPEPFDPNANAGNVEAP